MNYISEQVVRQKVEFAKFKGRHGNEWLPQWPEQGMEGGRRIGLRVG